MNAMKTIISNFCLSVLLLHFMAFVVFAEISVNERGPVHVTADRLEADDNDQRVVFSGNAIATQDDVTLRGDRLIIIYTGEKREIEKVVAEGHVRIIKQEKVATGEKAVFFRSEGRIVMTGSPTITEGENFVEGEEITIFLDDERSIISGGDGGRVNAVFFPKSE